METITLKENAKLLEKQIGKVKGQFTLNDAASMTGVPTEQAREALNELMEKYVCRLVVTENGDLIYDFGSSPLRRGEKTFAERWESIKAWLWKAFTIFFKIWIAVTLVVYFIIFVVILIAAIVALTASDKDNNNRGSGGAGKMLSGVFDLFWAIFRWNTIMGYQRTYYEQDRYGYRYKHYEPQKSAFNPKKKNFIASVYDFVFGPPRVEQEPFANQKEVAAYARQKKGIVSLSELKGLAGWNTEQAQAFLSDCVVRFNGDARISPENAVLYADLSDLIRSTNQEHDGQVEWYWDEFEPEYELTGNTTGRNGWVIFMNLFNLAFATFFLVSLAERIQYEPEMMAVWIGLGIVPFVFSFIFFTVPLLRWAYLLPKRKQRHRNNQRKRLVKVIYQNAGKKLSLSQVEMMVNQGHPEKLDRALIEELMRELVIDWDAEAAYSSENELVYNFENLGRELQEAEKLRSNRNYRESLGNTYFDTKELE